MGKKNKTKQNHLQEVKTQEPNVETNTEIKREDEKRVPNESPQEPLVINPEKQTIGAYLKQNREEKKISLRTISQKTRISYTILSSLEEDRLNELPDQTYVKGFIKSVAKEIGLNENEAIQILNNTYETLTGDKVRSVQLFTEQSDHETINQPIPQQNETIPDKDPDHRSIGHKVSKVMSPGAILGLVAGGFVLTIIFIFMHLNKSQKDIASLQTKRTNKIQLTESVTEIDSDETRDDEAEVILPTPMIKVSQTSEQNSAKLVADNQSKTPTQTTTTDSTQNNSSTETTITTETTQVTEVTSQKTNPTIESHQVTSKEENKENTDTTESQSDEDQQEERISINIRPFNVPLYTLDSDAKEIDDEDILKPQFKNALISGKQNVLVTAHEGDTWLTYKTDSDDVRNFVLKKGRSVMIRGEDVRLFLGNAGVAKVFVNNELVKFKSPSGVKSLVFPHENTKKYTLPLFIYDKKQGNMLTTQDYINRYGP